MATLTATPRSGVRSGASTVFMASTPFLQLQALWDAEFVVKSPIMPIEDRSFNRG